ncbi:HAD hydrolase-like protein [Citricoccus nitrophenolicus]|uniref:Phosphonatase-like hydrolase n=1 Tax=Citricoccus muralis TaxID=169134 RepID=A0A3D9LI25_9MICC|nr:HAD family hydrolase [Citricoccus muralis]REE05107.1 phosphonatase-like hydrolase [Citricoccus muralis]
MMPANAQPHRDVRSRRPLKLAVLDMSGTTVDEGGLQDEAFNTAILQEGIEPGGSRSDAMVGYFREARGTSRHEIFRSIFAEDPVAARRANACFEATYDRLLAERGVRPVDGAAEAVAALREAGMKIVLTTGFARHTQNMILESLDWMGVSDLSLCPSDAGRGAPYPDMILTALLALDLEDVRSVMTVGDTAGDIRAGQRAGAGLTVGVLTGYHDEAVLRGAGAAAVVPSIRDVPALVTGAGC